MGLRRRIQKILTGQVPLGIPILKMRIINKTANYTVLRSESGSLFHTRGTGSNITFTLPAPEDGLFYYFMGAGSGDLIVAGPSNQMVAFNDATATSVAFQTTSEQIGGGFLLASDGVRWFAFAMPYGLGATAQTVTIT